MTHEKREKVEWPSARTPEWKMRLDAALAFHWYGLRITLCEGKKPLGCDWSQDSMGYQWQTYTWANVEIQRAFCLRPGLNVGVRLGPDSGIIDIEGDGPNAETDFAELFDGCDIPVTPTFSSRRGKHRLFAWDSRFEGIGKAKIEYKGLEIRIGANGKGAQSLLPPSTTDGVARTWLASLDDCDPAQLPEIVIERLLSGSSRGHGMKHMQLPVCAVSTVPAALTVSTAPTVFQAVEWAIAKTLPTEAGQRNRCLFELARHLKAIPELADADVSALRPYVAQWHQAALPFIATKAFEESWFEFAVTWKRVKYPAGSEPIAMIYQQSLRRGLPVVALQYQQTELRRLVALCRELQTTSGERPFFLTCRAAGELLGVSHATAWLWLQGLVVDKVLAEVTKGKRQKGSEYRYIASEVQDSVGSD